jgi:hypothetical protein
VSREFPQREAVDYKLHANPGQLIKLFNRGGKQCAAFGSILFAAQDPALEFPRRKSSDPASLPSRLKTGALKITSEGDRSVYDVAPMLPISCSTSVGNSGSPVLEEESGAMCSILVGKACYIPNLDALRLIWSLLAH